MQQSTCAALLFSSLLLACGSGQMSAEFQPATTAQGATPAGHLSQHIGAWSFNEGAGLTTADASGHGHQATLHGARFIPNANGHALEFDGLDDFVEVNDRAPFDIATLDEGTISLWFRFDSVPGLNTIQPLFYFGDGVGGAGNSSLLIEVGHFHSHSAIYFTIYTDNAVIPQCFDSGFELVPGQLYHFAAVVDQKPSLGPNKGLNTGYLNGVELTARHYNYGTASDAYFFSDIAHGQETWFGRGFLNTIPKIQFLDGVIDEVLIWNQPLNAKAIAAYYAATQPLMFDPAPIATSGSLVLVSQTPTAGGSRLELGVQGATPLSPVGVMINEGESLLDFHAASHVGDAHWTVELPRAAGPIALTPVALGGAPGAPLHVFSQEP